MHSATRPGLLAALLPLALALVSPAQAATSYTIKLGDTLWGIARKQGVSLSRLIAANPQIPDPDLIVIGQRIVVPIDEPSGETPFEPRPTQPQSTANTPTTQKPVARKPVARKPVAKKPVARKPVAQKPVAQKPRSGQSVAKKPTPTRRTTTVAADPARQVLVRRPEPVTPVEQPETPRRPAFLSLRLPQQFLTGNRQGAANRGPGCTSPRKSLAALLPDTNLGLVVAEQPTFFWYMPTVEAEGATEVEFVLSAVDERGLDVDPPVYTTRFPARTVSGVASLTVPPDRPPLATGRDYRWSLSIICNPDDRSQDEEVSGWVRRIEPDAQLAERFKEAKPADYPALYAEAGLWFDALKYLAALRRRADDPALAEDWAGLLKAVGLPQVADKPLTCVGPSTEAGVHCPQTAAR